jgi:hypothetical protein
MQAPCSLSAVHSLEETVLHQFTLYGGALCALLLACLAVWYFIEISREKH